jgi:hypothetical protein
MEVRRDFALSPFMRGDHEQNHRFKDTFTQSPETLGRAIVRVKAPHRIRRVAQRRLTTPGAAYRSFVERVSSTPDLLSGVAEEPE